MDEDRDLVVQRIAADVASIKAAVQLFIFITILGIVVALAAVFVE